MDTLLARDSRTLSVCLHALRLRLTPRDEEERRTHVRGASLASLSSAPPKGDKPCGTCSAAHTTKTAPPSPHHARPPALQWSSMRHTLSPGRLSHTHADRVRVRGAHARPPGQPASVRPGAGAARRQWCGGVGVWGHPVVSGRPVRHKRCVWASSPAYFPACCCCLSAAASGASLAKKECRRAHEARVTRQRAC